QPSRARAVERSEIDSLCLGSALRKEQKVTSIRKKLRKTVAADARAIQLRDRLRPAPRRRHTHERTGVRSRKQDRPVSAPCATAAGRRVRYDLWRSAGDVDPF